MRQFDVHPNPSKKSRPIAPFVVVLQSHHLAAAPTTVVAPMIVNDGRSAYTETSALVLFRGAQYIVSVAELAAIDSRHLQQPDGDLRDHEDELRRALERLFTGF